VGQPLLPLARGERAQARSHVMISAKAIMRRVLGRAAADAFQRRNAERGGAQFAVTTASPFPFWPDAVAPNVLRFPTPREPTVRAAKGCPPPFMRDVQP
jgi:hypothetical protein